MATAPADSPHDWTRSPQPLLTAGPSDVFDGGGVTSPRVVPVDGKHWHMYYVGYHPTLKQGGMPVHQIGLAKSDDGGLTWRRTSGKSVISHGEPGSYDAFSTSSASVRRVGDCWLLWYGGIAQVPYLVSICLATSEDGHTWRKDKGNPVFRYDPTLPGEATSVAKPHVILEGGIFRMWYSAMGRDASAKYRICQAESKDGLNWERFSGNPVLGPAVSGWDHDMVEYADVLRDAAGYHMWYCGDGYGSIGYATGAPRRVVVQARGGLTPQPDASWRVWSAPLAAASGSQISLKADRYVQMRVSVALPGGGETGSDVEDVCVWSV